MELYIEIVDACNLRCISCPRGRREFPNTHKQMTPVLLKRILDKAQKECKLTSIDLYEVGEPTMHKDLPEMIRLASKYAPVCISTNASVPNTDWKSILEAGLHKLILSTSGWTQAVYERGHQGGSVEMVNKAIIDIAQNNRWIPSHTILEVLYHRYKYNLHEESLVRKQARWQGWKFVPIWASVMPPESTTNECEAVLDPTEGWKVAEAAGGHSCVVLETILSIDVDGNVWLCGCGPSHPGIANFLDQPLSEIQSIRRHHPYCVNCLRTSRYHYVTRDNVVREASAHKMGYRPRYLLENISHRVFNAKRWLRNLHGYLH